jgi:hypothetical protein
MYDPDPPRISPRDAALRRANHRCCFRFEGCHGRTNQVMLNQPEWLGADGNTANLRAVCRNCKTIQLEQRGRAAALFGIREGAS